MAGCAACWVEKDAVRVTGSELLRIANTDTGNRGVVSLRNDTQIVVRELRREWIDLDRGGSDLALLAGVFAFPARVIHRDALLFHESAHHFLRHSSTSLAQRKPDPRRPIGMHTATRDLRDLSA